MDGVRQHHGGAQLIDLEQLIRQRQDQLRGRPEDWIDRFGDWRRNADWVGIAIIIGPFALLLLITGIALL